MKKAVFLDRDGVINEVLSGRVQYVNSPDQFYLLNGVGESIKRLNDEGFLVFVVTNQAGVGLGYITEKTLDLIHRKMKHDLSKFGATIDDIAYCPHKPWIGCSCRKPNSGMILYLANKHDVNLKESFMIGDRGVDIQAGKEVKATTILVGQEVNKIADYHFFHLSEAVDFILKKS